MLRLHRHWTKKLWATKPKKEKVPSMGGVASQTNAPSLKPNAPGLARKLALRNAHLDENFEEPQF